MTLNKWLCRNFDKESRGYVEIGNIINVCLQKIFTETNLLVFIFLFIIPTIIGFMYYSRPSMELEVHIPLGYQYTNGMLYLLTNTSTVSGLFMTFWLVGLVPYVVIYLFYLILKIKIAKCSLK